MKDNLDKIEINSLSISAFVGITKKERENPQNININLILYTNLKKAAKSDSIHDTIDYHSLSNKIKKHCLNNSFNLIEKMAYDICKICLKNPLAKKVDVKIEKPNAVSFAKNCAVFMSKEK